MELTLDRAADAAERHPCPKCEAPAGSACRTRSGKVAAKYHTARFILVPALREELAVAVPADRGPGTPWKPGPPIPAAGPQPTAAPIRIGYSVQDQLMAGFVLTLAVPPVEPGAGQVPGPFGLKIFNPERAGRPALEMLRGWP
jgi:hypothetical protein